MTAEQPAGVRYTRDVGPGDVGARVSLRRRLPGGLLGDVLGVLESWSGDGPAVRRRDGTLVQVAEADLLAVKRVPPPPGRRR